jgi:hypothetical protein
MENVAASAATEFHRNRFAACYGCLYAMDHGNEKHAEKRNSYAANQNFLRVHGCLYFDLNLLNPKSGEKLPQAVRGWNWRATVDWLHD